MNIEAPLHAQRVAEREKIGKEWKTVENDIIGNSEIDLNIHFCSVFYFKVLCAVPFRDAS
jgi:hypothetical protein